MKTSRSRQEYLKAERERSRRRYAANREVWLLKRTEYIKNHPEEHKARCKNWRTRNKDRMKQLLIEWAKDNADKRAATAAAQRASRLLRIPKWLSPADYKRIAEIYSEATRLTFETGILHHVDHDLPLQGKLVSGLHVPSNLCPVPAEINLKKNNKCPIY